MTPKGLLRLKQAGSVARRPRRGRFEPVLDDPRRRPRVGRDAPRALLGQDLLRHRRPRGPRRRELGRGRAARAALPVPGRAGRRAHSRVPEPAGARLGAGGAAEHGRLAARSVTASRPRRPTAFRCATSAAPGARARARATRPRTGSSRTGSSARRWGPRRPASAACGGARIAARDLGAVVRAALSTCLRCAGGSRRQRW